MKEFRVIQENGEETRIVCADIKQSVKTLDTVLNPVTQVVRTRVSIQVDVPDAALDVNFRTLIAGAGAEFAGCRATPSTFEVKDGTPVIFEAFTAEGYNFVGWFKGSDTTGIPEATTKITSIVIAGVLGVSQDIIVSALFAPVVI